ncbi:MAG: UDP-2,3-diacylglucosamine diphosphatase LpxI [Phycisphaerae bacterium]|nr:UDP-2,3-diacylglucosamine diphosphatase LpxI [Phycisphaerae bacterium]
MAQDSAAAEPSALGLIAGSGEFPLLVARGAKRAGCRLVVVGLRGLADESLIDLADRFHWSGIAQLGRWIRLFRRERIDRAILAGSVRKTDMLMPLWRLLLRYPPDLTTIRLWFFKLPDRRNDTVLRGVGEEMAQRGVRLVDSTQYCPEAMAEVGVLTRTAPTGAQQRDADLGWDVAKEMGRLDVGQSVAVKDGDVIAVEAIEGTDRMIARAGELCRKGGFVHVKVAKPEQDMRFDVPTIGPDTIKNLHAAGAGCLVVEAGKTLIVNRQETLALADQFGIAVVGRRGPGEAPQT